MNGNLTNIEIFGDYFGRKFISTYGTEYLVKSLKLFKCMYKETRREYLKMYKNLKDYNQYYRKDISSRSDYYSTMGLEYLFH